MKKDLVKNFVEQLDFELYSGYLYLAMSLKFDLLELSGMSKWMRLQAKEELSHAEGFMEYLRLCRAEWTPGPIEAPAKIEEKPKALFEQALKHEETVTARLRDLAEKAEATGDFLAVDFVTGFLKEQLEEEDQLKTIIAQLKFGGEAAWVYLDCELGKRQ